MATIPVARVCWTAAAAALGYAVQLGNGHLNADAIVLLEWAIGLALVALVAPRCSSTPSTELVSVVALCAVLVYQFSELLTVPPGIYLSDASDGGLRFFRYGVALAALLCAALASRNFTGRGRFFLLSSLLLAVHFALGVWIVRASPNPFIDTFVFQRDSVRALFAGDNPYALTFPNIYHDDANYGPGMSQNGRLTFGFVYPPFSLLLSAAGAAIGGDVRFAQAAATTLAGACMLLLGGGRRVAVLATAVFLFTPRGFFVLEQSWTEPFLVLLFAGVLLCAARKATALPYVAGLLFAVKQHMALVFPLLWLLPNQHGDGKSVRAYLVKMLATIAAVTFPFVLWNPSAFYRSAISLQFQQPYRPDALSFAAIWAAEHGRQMPQYVPFLCAVAGIAFALWRAPRTTAGMAGAVGFVYLVFFAFAKQAFCNYYYFVIGLFCCAIACDQTALRSNAGGAGQRDP